MPRTPVPHVVRLDLEEGPGKLARRVSAALIGAIADGRLADGDPVPSTRTLSRSLGVARSVVVDAYDELTAAGFLVTRAGSGSRVEIGAGDAARAGARSSAAAPAAARRPVHMTGPRVSMNLLPGYPDVALLNEKDWNRAWRRASRTVLRAAEGSASHGHVTQPGSSHRALREQLAEHLRVSRGVLSDPDDILLFPGVNAAIRTVARASMTAGRTLAFEDPGYPAARRAFTAAGSDVRSVGVDDGGLVVDDLAATDWGVYLTPAHQYPLGARLPVSRRSALLDWATHHDAVVFEDDYDGEFRYDVPPMPPLRAMTAGADRVVYLGTASKVLARDVRLAWAVVPPWLAGPARTALLEEGDSVSAVAALAMADLIATGSLARQIASSHRTYSARRRRLATACEQVLPTARLHGISAGLHLVLTFDGPFDDVTVVADLLSRGVACAPLSSYFDTPRRAALHGLVCGYSCLPETRAMEAVRLIRDVVEAHTPARA